MDRATDTFHEARRYGTARMMARSRAWLAASMCVPVFFCTGFCAAQGSQKQEASDEGPDRFEASEVNFARERLVREAGSRLDAEQIRKAYRKLALRLSQTLYGQGQTLETQLRLLNLAKDALVRGVELAPEEHFSHFFFCRNGHHILGPSAEASARSVEKACKPRQKLPYVVPEDLVGP